MLGQDGRAQGPGKEPSSLGASHGSPDLHVGLGGFWSNLLKEMLRVSWGQGQDLTGGVGVAPAQNPSGSHEWHTVCE